VEKLSLKDLQHLELEIFKYFISLCEKYKLRYFLAGGTLLGAIRHKGFIPWDDDIDVLMPRTDYDRLQNIGKKLCDKRYKLASFELGNLNYPFAKIFDTHTQIKKIFDFDETEQQVWIDIFPLDGLPESDAETEKIFKKSLFMRDILKIQKSQDGSAKSTFKKIVKPVLKPILLKCIGIEKSVEKIDRFGRNYSFDDYDYIGGIVWGYGKQEKMKKTEYLKTVQVDFEGLKVNAPGCWDKYLTNLYGDYMRLPPEEQRLTHDMEIWLIK